MYRISFILLLSALLAQGCKSKKKVVQLQEQNQHYETRVKQLQSDSAYLSRKVDSLLKYTQTHKAVPEKESRKVIRARAEAEHYKQISLFLYNITKYVDWPDIETPSFTIAVVGNDLLLNDIQQQFNGKKIANKPVEIKRMHSAKDLTKADIYFISHHKLHYMQELFKHTHQNRTLIVSDHHHPTNGIHINFFTEADNLKFDLNENEIQKSNIVMSSALKVFQH